MLLSAAALLVGFGLFLVVLEAVFQYYGLGAIGGIIIGLIGTRITETGLVRDADSYTRTVEFGDIPIGFLVMIVGALILILSLHRYRMANA